MATEYTRIQQPVELSNLPELYNEQLPVVLIREWARQNKDLQKHFQKLDKDGNGALRLGNAWHGPARFNEVKCTQQKVRVGVFAMNWQENEVQVVVTAVGTSRCSCVIEACNSTVTVHPLTEWMPYFVTGANLLLKGIRTAWCEDEVHIYLDPFSKIFPFPSAKRGVMQVAEIFAGLGGWSNAGKVMGVHTAIYVEACEVTARACAKTHQCQMMTATEYIDLLVKGNQPVTVVLHADVKDDDTWMAMAMANVGYIAGSPPCQPWSGTGRTKGLFAEDGQVFAHVLQRGAKGKILVMILENVSHITKHPDYKELLKNAAMQGMRMIMADNHEISKWSPVKRERWLGTFVHSSVPVVDDNVVRARSITVANESFHVDQASPSLCQVNGVHVNMSASERAELCVDDEALVALGNYQFAPWWITATCSSTNPEDIMRTRIVKENQQLFAIMASYGGQHLLPQDLLSSKGLQTILTEDSQGVRYFSPWEFAKALGYGNHTVLPNKVRLAWKMIGNGLSMLHAFLQLYKTHIALGDLSFISLPDAIERVFTRVHSAIGNLADMHVMDDGEWCWLVEDAGQPQKRAKVVIDVPPTVPFVSEETVLQTRTLQGCPEFAMDHNPMSRANQTPNGLGGMVMLAHCEKHWAMCVHGERNSSVKDVFNKAIPYAQGYNFLSFKMDQADLHWESKITCVPMKVLVFTPIKVPITCCISKLGNEIALLCDVTWTTRTMLAYVATHVGCNVESLTLWFQNRMMGDDEYIMENQGNVFEVAFRAMPEKQMTWCPPAIQVADPGLTPAPCYFWRFCARHPTKKVIRTLVCKGDVSVASIVQQMFPDLHAAVPWLTFQDAHEIDPCKMVHQVGTFEIQWNGFKPIGVTVVTKLRFSQEINTPAMQSTHVESDDTTFWIRSPFQCKPVTMKLPKHVMIQEVAASFFAMSQANVSMLAMQDQNVLDPTMLVSELDPMRVVTFRVCPLLGGAKFEGVKVRIKSELERRGVPQEVLAERTNAFIGKIQLEKLTGYKESDRDGFWDAMKKLATECRFRLITPGELKAHQKSMRKDQQKQVHPPAKKNNMSQFVPKAEEVVIDMAHFTANKQGVQALENARFGPDQSGLSIMNASDTRKFQASGVKSCDPLAILVVDADMHGFPDVFQMPAHTKQGQPIIVRAALVQFGDQPIQYEASVMSLNVDQVAATTIEFFIMRNLVTNWADAAVPLQFLGVQVPSLRGSNLMSAWSIRSWSSDRKQCSVDKADYWHGYFRVGDHLLNSVLGRSGANGIILNPKGSDKKHDGRYGIVMLPGKSLQQVLSLAEACEHSLGITMVGNNFAVRCQKQNLDHLRAKLMPESAFVEATQVEPDQQLYILRNVGQVSKEGLSHALQEGGWQAQAIKTQGIDKWIIAARTPPKCSHMVVNGSLTIVEPLSRNQGTIPITMVAQEVQVQTTVDMQNQTMQISSTTRMAEVKAESQAQLNAVVEEKLGQAHAQIQALNEVIAQSQQQNEAVARTMAAEVATMKDEQAFTKQKMMEMETTMNNSSQAIIGQMQNMFKTMQANLESTLTQQLSLNQMDPEKRARLEGKEPKHDPFATTKH
eukprot:Skav221297  [mRNA]  locus=scaffold1920:293158:299702:- [translate_table: standard]